MYVAEVTVDITGYYTPANEVGGILVLQWLYVYHRLAICGKVVSAR